MDLEEAINALKQRIQVIEAAGAIAPANTWIDEFRAGSKRKDGYQYYTYYKLMAATDKKSKTGKIQGKQIAYLGKAGSRKYREAREAIERRNAVQRLRDEIKYLSNLMDKTDP